MTARFLFIAFATAMAVFLAYAVYMLFDAFFRGTL